MIRFIQPLPRPTRDYIAQVNGIRIRVCLNTEDVLQYVLRSGIYWEVASDKAEPVECMLCLLQTDVVHSEYIFHQDRSSDVRSLPKTEENSPNLRYTLGELTIGLFSYPNHSVHIETHDQSSITVLAGDRYVLIFYLKEYIKRIVSRRIGLPRLHAGAVAKRHGAVAFLGPGNAGKSTISYNLTTSGWTMLHDDLIFLERRADGVFVQGIQVNPCLRRAALPYVVDGYSIMGSRDVFYNSYHECCYLRNVKLMQKPVLLKAILLISGEADAQRIPTPVCSDLRQVLRGYAVDHACLEQLRDIPVYGISRNVPVEQMDRFLEDLVNKC